MTTKTGKISGPITMKEFREFLVKYDPNMIVKIQNSSGECDFVIGDKNTTGTWETVNRSDKSIFYICGE